MRKPLCMAAMLITISLVLSACDSLLPQVSSQNRIHLEKQVLNLTVSEEPATLDSAVAIDPHSVNLLNNVMEGLMRLGKDNKPEPAIAQQVDVSSDKRVYTFHLREARWSDGESVRAEDFAYAWKRVLQPQTRSRSAYLFFPIQGAQDYHHGRTGWNQVGIRVVDEQTLRVTLTRPIPYFLELTTTSAYLPQRADIVERLGESYGKNAAEIVYDGPFRISGWEQGKNIILTRNEQYWDKGEVFLETVRTAVVRDTAEGIQLYHTYQTDAAQVDQIYADLYKKSSDWKEQPTASVQFLQFNLQKTLFRNPYIRKAFSYAIDREALTDDLLKDGSMPAGSVIPPAILPINERSGEIVEKRPEFHRFDPQQAQAWLKKGMDELNLKSFPEEVVMTVPDTDKQVALFLQNQFLHNLGVEVKIDPKPLRRYPQQLDRGEFDIAINEWRASYRDPGGVLVAFSSEGPCNPGKWSALEYDRWLEQAASTADEEKRIGLYLKAEKKLLEDAAISPLDFQSEAFIQRRWVKNMVRHPFGADLTLKEAFIEGKK
ncbi:peptide ABC transporter substrate-binding protein [Polycladomyces subterraneus]|uniref:Peptide ABC transporter substrate-binding protein n=1 Tax=Polycladomyces subterraneus TaxID=1016997 RepID=A0ABT8IIM7_9BACL|nr:peptide ABC transporter substrate-binding protein [Polycladomyces subterraneus]MDN4592600.1 peptide ABC transporter substrate-binding protein [Polycladomyces subterraneus]